MSEFVDDRRSGDGSSVQRSLRPARSRFATRRGQPPSYFDTQPAALDITSVSMADLARSQEWTQAFSSSYKDRRYYEIVAKTLHPEFEHRYFVVRDENGVAAAVQPYFVLDQDILTGTSGKLKTAVGVIRRRWPKFMSMRTLMVGCVAGEGHLSDRAVFADPSVALRLGREAVAEARRHKAQLIVFKEFPAKYRPMLERLPDAGYTRLPSLPMASLNIDYANFDEYMTKVLSRAARKDLRRKLKATSAAAISLSVTSDISASIDELYPLYLQVYERSPLRFEKLTKEYFCDLGSQMPDKTRFFVWRENGRAIAFSLCMVDGDTIYDQYIGLDYAVALDLHLYHYTFRDIVSWAMANGVTWYRTNGLNYDPKLHLRMSLDPLDLYVRHRWSAANAIMKIVLPWLEPTQYDKHLKKFPNFHELKGA